MRFEFATVFSIAIMVALYCFAMTYGAIRDYEKKQKIELVESQKLKQCKTN